MTVSTPRNRRTLVPPGVPVTLWKFEVLVGSVGVILLAFALGLLILGNEQNLAFRFTWTLAMFLIVALTPGITIRRGNRYDEYKLWEYPTVFGIIIGPWYLVPIAAATALVIPLAVLAWRDRHRRHELPFLFGSVIAVLFGGALLATVNPPVSLVAAAGVAALSAELLLFHHARLSGDPTAEETLRQSWYLRFLLATTIATGLWFVSLFDAGRFFVLVLPGFYLLSHRLITTILDRQARQRASETMEEISAELIGMFDENSVIQTAVIRGIDLFGVEEIVVEIGSEPHGGFRYCHTNKPGAGIEVETLTGLTDCAALPEREALRTRSISLTARSREIGQVLLKWPTTVPPDRSPRMQFLQTFAHAVSATLLAARTHNEVSKQATAKAYEAQHDKLTGLGNRAMLFETGPTNIDASLELGGWCALLLLDLDGFKGINDTLGHTAGDKVLQEVGRRFSSVVRSEDMAVRLGGDEFAVLATNMANPADADLLTVKLQSVLVSPIEVDGLSLTVEASVGIAIYGKDAHDIQTLYQLADIALYKAKARGRGTAYRYRPADNGHTTEALQLSTELRHAIHRSNELVLYYQPQVDIRTGDMVGMEALARWNHPTRGLLSPDVFVPLAEQSAFIRQFTLAIVRQALRDRAAVRHLLPDATVSVNLAARNLLDQGFSIDVAAALKEFGVPGRELVVEVTETSAPADLEVADGVLHALRDLGVQVAFDDFLTGNASLEALRRETTPIHEIKIERDFVKNMMTRDLDRVAIESIVNLAHARNCRVVAEGVETQDMLTALKAMGCDYAQGYLIARPQPLSDLVAWIHDHTGARAASRAR